MSRFYDIITANFTQMHLSGMLEPVETIVCMQFVEV